MSIQIKSNDKLQGWPKTPVADRSIKSSPFLVFQPSLLFFKKNVLSFTLEFQNAQPHDQSINQSINQPEFQGIQLINKSINQSFWESYQPHKMPKINLLDQKRDMDLYSFVICSLMQQEIAFNVCCFFIVFLIFLKAQTYHNGTTNILPDRHLLTISLYVYVTYGRSPTLT